jgi:hypothetical protein
VSDGWDKTARTGGKTEGAPAVIDVDNSRITGGEPPVNFVIVARDESGRFAKGASGNAALRFKKGQCGNPKGRPRGSGRFRSGARAAAALLDARAERITEKAVELALGGDAVAVRFCLGRLLGVRRGQPVELALPALAGARDLGGAVAAIAAALGEGQLTPDEALSLSQMLDGFPRVLAAAQEAAAAAAAASRAEDREDPRQKLIDELDRLAAEETLRQSQALATIPRSRGTARLTEPAAPPPSGS